VIWLVIGAAWLALTPTALADGIIIYVDEDATGAATGLSWTDAYTNVQDALDYTNAHGTTDYEIWAAEGVYYPDEGSHTSDDRTESFRINYNNVQLYGGFAGGETARDQRDWEAHPTVLSGDIDGNDWNTDANQIAETWNAIVGNNAYHVLYLDGVTNEPITETTVVDGFIVTAGQTGGSGAGLYCDGSGSGNECSPTIANMIFSGNSAKDGGGMYNDGHMFGISSPVLTDVTFSRNQATNSGGGLLNHGYFGDSSPLLTNVTFSGNNAVFAGGGMYNGGYNGTSNAVLTNVIFKGNRAEDGGGMYSFGYNNNLHGPGDPNEGNSNPSLINVTFSGNRATNSGGGIFNAGNTTLSNCILWGNMAPSGEQIYNDTMATLDYSLVEGGCPPNTNCGSNLLTSDPQFFAPILATAAPTTTGDYRLQFGAPAIDAGHNPSVTVVTDLDGHPRFVDGNGDGSAVVDMGAYEYIGAYEYQTPELHKAVNPTSAAPGDSITYTLTFSAGTGTATGVVITDHIPMSVTNTTVISHGVPITQQATTRYVWDVADLTPGTSGVITITGVLSDPLPSGVFTNTATIATSTDSLSSNNESSVGVTVTEYRIYLPLVARNQ
jgi:uncharacterized repeat protein (TIGR01451 family)